MSKHLSRLGYCQYLQTSPTNYTLTNFANHVDDMSHDAITRYLRVERLTPRLVWDNVRTQVVAHADRCVLFDDTVLDKNHWHRIELVRRQYSGNAHALINGIGVVNCVHVNPQTGEYWIIDYRIYDPDGDGKSKLDHVRDMLGNLVHHEGLLFRRVLMDTWYATRDLMLFIESLSSTYYCPLRDNRLVDDSGGESPYRRVDSLQWDEDSLAHGKAVKTKGFPKHRNVKLLRVAVSTHRTDWVVTNDRTRDSVQATQDMCRLRRKIEQFHREAKQLTGIECCQCRKARSQRNHIASAILVWVRLADIAGRTGRTLYRGKHDMLDEFLRRELRNPSVPMRFA
jgi:hypothetical protein